MALANVPPNPPSPDSLNINISAYRVLYILLLLVQYRSLDVNELNKFLFENPLIQRIYNTETLTKYINTLREVGCEIPRSSSRNDYSYELQKSPFPLKLDNEELTVAGKMLEVLCRQPDDALCNSYRDLLEQLAWCIETQEFSGERHGARKTVLFPELEARRCLLNTYRRYCQEAYTLALRYRDEQELLRDVLLEPHELIERGRQLVLLGVDPNSQEQQMLALERIVGVKQLPSKSKRTATQMPVVFALYGRLARSYRLYPGEKIVFQAGDECHVKAKVGEPSGLVDRLLKYGTSCQVLSPAPVRDLMRQRISRLLEGLSEEPPA